MDFATWRTALLALVLCLAGWGAPALAQDASDTGPEAQDGGSGFQARVEDFARRIGEANAALDPRGAYEHARAYRDYVLSVRKATHPDALQARLVDLSARLEAGYLNTTQADSDALIKDSIAAFGEKDVRTGRAFEMAGAAQLAHGEGQKAMFRFARAMDILDSALGLTHPEALAARQRYIEGLLFTGRAAEAIPLLLEALELTISAHGQQSPLTIPVAANLGVAHFQQGNDEEALRYTEEALLAHDEAFGRAHLGTLALWHNYASLLASLGRYEEARRQIEYFIGAYEKKVGLQHPDTIAAAQTYVDVLEKTGEPERALRIATGLYRTAFRTFGDDDPETVNARIRAYELELRHEGSSEDLVKRLWRANFSLEKLEPAHRPFTRTRVRGSASHRFKMLMLGKGVSARRADQRDLPFFETNFLRAEAMWFNPRRTEPEGSDAYDRPYPTGPKSALIALQDAMRRPTSGPVALAQARLRAALDGNEALLASWEKESAERLDLERRLFETFGGSDEAIRKRANLHYRLELAEAFIREDQALIEMTSPGFFNVLNKGAVESYVLDFLLEDDEVVLMIVPGPTATHVVAWSNASIAWNRSDMTAREVQSIVEELRAGLSVDGSGRLGYFDMALSHELYTRLIEPVAHAMDGQTHLYYIAHGSLSTLPPAVLLTEAPPEGADYNDPAVLREAAWLSDAFALIQLPTLETLELLRGSDTLRRRLKEKEGGAGSGNPAYSGFGDPLLAGEAALRGVGGAVLRAIDPAAFIPSGEGVEARSTIDPELVRAMPRLPGTRREVEAVRSGLDAPGDLVFYDDSMTEARIKRTDFTGVEILHLATHGVTAAQSQGLAEPGLIFTPPAQSSELDDGYLSAAEVIGLDLSSVRWAILSACNTAAPSDRAGEGGFSGLVRSFFMAGASTLLVSHWPVYDDVAAELASRAVRMNAQGLTRARALQESILQVRTDPKLDAAHPAVWAPFALVGEGR
ncbi:CHAT domain-containing tetratricopeptide repeat protein [Erythrobacter sp.]|uniref:CHAT domain-containing protein n=1 Tax=Erythrobacter sp. TaxID=1042 RepID=UPI001425D4AA|nr:CHAT domain-containing tetratricopeptide repeat protein [Erythrobacter sp.]QIQ86393.1 MAG: CHAT domain-containing protein [Erythrobacter sp.]